MRPWPLLAAGTIAAAFAAGAVAVPPPVSAPAFILVNPESEEVLLERAADRRLPMASTTKLMTAIVTIERTKLTDTVVVPRAAVSAGGSTSGLVPGERLSVRTLLTGLMIASGNDASLALAAHVGRGSEARFVGYMNAEAREMGLADTRFANPHGLDRKGHFSTVRDLVTLGERALQYPLLRQVAGRRVAIIPGPRGRGTRRLESENDLLAIDPEADGIKTGHTAGAGYALVAHAKRRSNGVELYAALIGAPSRSQRARDAKRLLDWGFAQYARLEPLRAGQVVLRIPVRDRPAVAVAVTVDQSLSTTIRLGRKLRRTIVAPAEIVGPVDAGEVVGEVTITEGPRVIGTRTLVLAESVDGPSVAERIRSGIGRLL